MTINEMYRGRVDLSQGERIFDIPAIPVWPEPDLEPGNSANEVGGTTLASFHGPSCRCGRPFGITYDLGAMWRCGADPNESLLHELTHAWQHYRDPEGCARRQAVELQRFGYWNAPHELEARDVAARLNDVGVRVWFPERTAVR